jgi:predicted permease
LARFGPVALAADECRDVRGTGFVDGLARDVLYALRTFRREPLAALTIVCTVALGLGLVAVVFTFLNLALFRVDEVRDPHELFAVERARGPDGEPVLFTRLQYEDLRRETNVFAGAVAMIQDIDSRIDGRMMAGALVTGNFFSVLGVDAARGRTLAPDDDEPGAGRPVMVLSHRGWARHFANAPGALGRSLLVNGVAFEIVGIMPDGFRGLGMAPPDYWAPLATVGQVRPIHDGRQNVVGVEIVGRLKPGLSREAAMSGLAVWHSQQAGAAVDRQRLPGVTLEPRNGTLPQPVEVLALFTPLFFAFGLVLVIGCANVANLLLARGVFRQREIGIRLSLGASRRRVVRQLLTESLLLAVAAAVLGYAISRLTLTAAVHTITSTMAPEFADYVQIGVPGADWRVVLFLVAGAIVATVGFGLSPALQATRLELVRTIRGEVISDARPGRARNALIWLQVTAAALLLVCSAVFLRSAMAASSVDPGIRTTDTVIIDLVNEQVRSEMVEAVRAEPRVAAVAASSPDALARPRAAFASAPGRTSPVAYRQVSPEYFDVLGIAIVRGRAFSPVERSATAAVAVVSERVARQLWPDGDAVGRTLQLEADPNSETRAVDERPLPVRAFTIVGISRDVAGFRLTGFKEADVYIPASAADAKTALTVRVHGDPDDARRALLQRLVAIDPNMGQVMTMRTLAGMETYLLRIAFWLTFVLGGLACVLTLSGLFSVLSYLVEQRTREIGVRMALGASTRAVGQLVLAQTVRPVGYGLIAGAGLAAALGILLMATPAAAQIGAIVRVFDPVAYVSSLLFIVTACALAALIPALRAARVDPMTALRQE